MMESVLHTPGHLFSPFFCAFTIANKFAHSAWLAQSFSNYGYLKHLLS